MTDLYPKADQLKDRADLYHMDQRWMEQSRADFYQMIREARATMSLNTIAKLTGLSKQRVAQIEKLKW